MPWISSKNTLNNSITPIPDNTVASIGSKEELWDVRVPESLALAGAMSISRRCRRRYSGPAICSSIDLGALRGRSNGSAQLCIYGDI